ncbi:MAG: hypothetical protein OEW17_01590 [Gemmatimonadota bacterium]|nr:hypothetical protein [Gemmatimonadota bacterium]MDH4347474.1 hypothetical protein [Gemmatimonadota bacterium]
MSHPKLTDLPKKSISDEQAEDVKGGRKMKKFGGKGGNAKKRRLNAFSKESE